MIFVAAPWRLDRMLAALHYGNWLPPMLSEHGDKIDRIIDILHVFMVLLFVGWGLFFVYCLAKFRQRTGHRADYNLIKAKASKYAEIAVGIFEAVILLAFSMPVWADYKNKPPDKDKRFEVRVVGEQFQWDFHYPGKDGVFGQTDSKFITASNPLGLRDDDPNAKDDIVTINDFHVPVGKPIYVRLTTKDVIHSFAIPTMRVKQDAIPGMEIPIWFTVDPKATSDWVREQMTETFPVERLTWYRVRHHIAAVDYKTKDGEVLLAKGADLGATFEAGDELFAKLKKAGIREIVLQPRNPLEVVCAQLCGNSHFKMKAQFVTHDEAGFTKWLEESSKKPEMKEDF
jgi:cytochrome c oxidase subunit 2